MSHGRSHGHQPWILRRCPKRSGVLARRSARAIISIKGVGFKGFGLIMSLKPVAGRFRRSPMATVCTSLRTPFFRFTVEPSGKAEGRFFGVISSMTEGDDMALSLAMCCWERAFQFVRPCPKYIYVNICRFYNIYPHTHTGLTWRFRLFRRRLYCLQGRSFRRSCLQGSWSILSAALMKVIYIYSTFYTPPHLVVWKRPLASIAPATVKHFKELNGCACTSAIAISPRF